MAIKRKEKLLAAFCAVMVAIAAWWPLVLPRLGSGAASDPGGGELQYELSADRTFYRVIGVKDDRVTEAVIPATYRDLPVREIGEQAFYGCADLARVAIPDGVTAIGASAFEGCSALASIALPGSLTDIGERAFKKCIALRELTVPECVTSIGGDAFVFSGITSVVLENTDLWHSRIGAVITIDPTDPGAIAELLKNGYPLYR